MPAIKTLLRKNAYYKGLSGMLCRLEELGTQQTRQEDIAISRYQQCLTMNKNLEIAVKSTF